MADKLDEKIKLVGFGTFSGCEKYVEGVEETKTTITVKAGSSVQKFSKKTGCRSPRIAYDKYGGWRLDDNYLIR